MSHAGKVLKGAAPLAARLVPAAVHDADRRVREALAAADERARAIRAAAEADRERIVREATEEGRREGLARAAAALAFAAAERDRILAEAEPQLVSLALSVARTVLGEELTRPEAVVALAARALAEVRERREVVVRVSPADAAAVGAASGRLAPLLARAPLAVREDASLRPGDVVVETEAGRVDARVETQLELLARALADAERAP